MTEASLAAGFDSVMTCFSKGLRAPVGSAVSGSKDFIAEARRVRKLFGGGMRQAGVIAAAALVGLEEERSRLPEDHARATKLAAGLAGIRGIRIDVASVETNIVIFSLEGEWGPAQDVLAKLSSRGILAGDAGPSLDPRSSRTPTSTTSTSSARCARSGRSRRATERLRQHGPRVVRLLVDDGRVGRDAGAGRRRRDREDGIAVPTGAPSSVTTAPTCRIS